MAQANKSNTFKPVKPFVIKNTIDPLRVVHMLIVACEGGSNYWCKEVTPHTTKGFEDSYWAMLNGFHLKEKDPDAAEVFVSRKDIENALQLFATETPIAYADFLNEDEGVDAEGADCFLQLCAFGRIVYG